MMAIKIGAAIFFIVGGVYSFAMAQDSAMAVAMLAFALAAMASFQADILHRRVSELELSLSKSLSDKG